MPTKPPSHAHIWIWLPDALEPTLCGQITAEGAYHLFTYHPTYLARNNAIALDPVELPLIAGRQRSDYDIHRAIRDAAPDSWGRRVILYQQQLSFNAIDGEFTEIAFL